MQKSWMWHSDSSNGVAGAIIDFDENRVQWLNEPGCACSGSSMEQTIEDFRDNGSRYLLPPEDVLEEMQTIVNQVLST